MLSVEWSNMWLNGTASLFGEDPLILGADPLSTTLSLFSLGPRDWGTDFFTPIGVFVTAKNCLPISSRTRSPAGDLASLRLVLQSLAGLGPSDLPESFRGIKTKSMSAFSSTVLLVFSPLPFHPLPPASLGRFGFFPTPLFLFPFPVAASSGLGGD